MKFPTKANRPGEIPAYTKAGLGRVPETRLEQYDLPKAANIGDAWKEVVGTGAKLYSQYEEMLDTNYITEMSPRYRDAYLKAYQKAMEETNPLDDALNFSKNVYAKTEATMVKWEEENFKENRANANQALVKSRKAWMLEDLETSNTFSAKAMESYGVTVTAQAMDGALGVVKTQYSQDVRNGGGVYDPAHTTSVVQDGRVQIQRGTLQASGLHYNGVADAIAKAEKAMHEQNYKQWKAHIISTDQYTKNMLAIPIQARTTMFQHVYDEASNAYLRGDYQTALKLVRSIPDSVLYTETSLIMTKDGVFAVKPEYAKQRVVTEATKHLPKEQHKFEDQYIPMSFYEKRNAKIEQAGAEDGVQVYTNRTSILSTEQQQKYINSAALLENNILNAMKVQQEPATYDQYEVEDYTNAYPWEQ